MEKTSETSKHSKHLERRQTKSIFSCTVCYNFSVPHISFWFKWKHLALLVSSAECITVITYSFYICCNLPTA